jgi:hypothetical protein
VASSLSGCVQSVRCPSAACAAATQPGGLFGGGQAVEPNHGRGRPRRSDDGAISRVVDVFASQGHIVPTALACKGNFFVGNLDTFPVVPGRETVFKLTPGGNLKPWATGLTTILGIAFDGRDRVYVLETSNHAGAPAPGNGDIVRIDPSGAQTTIVSRLTFPTGMTMGPDGALYIGAEDLTESGISGPKPWLEAPNHSMRRGDRVPPKVPGVASTPPIKVSEKDGLWNVEYADGVEQNFQSEAEAMVAAQEVADREGRVIERA